MSSFDSTADQRPGETAEPAGIPERIDDRPEEHAPDAGTDGTVAPAGAEPGANGGLRTGEDPTPSLAEDLGLAPGATDAADAGQDNGLNS